MTDWEAVKPTLLDLHFPYCLLHPVIVFFSRWKQSVLYITRMHIISFTTTAHVLPHKNTVRCRQMIMQNKTGIISPSLSRSLELLLVGTGTSNDFYARATALFLLSLQT